MIIICERLNIHLQRLQEEAWETNKELALTLLKRLGAGGHVCPLDHPFSCGT